MSGRGASSPDDDRFVIPIMETKKMSAAMDLKLKAMVERVCPEVIRIRHRLHQNPELAGEEYQTAALIRKTLAGTRIQLLRPYLKTDVVGILKGRKPGRNITLRADMDALPLLEKNTFAHVSKIKGCMHACGHDGHTAMLLGAARVLQGFTDEFDGTIRFVFQPGEEVAALGKDLVERGALEHPRPDMIIAVHGWAGIPTGMIQSRPGVLMAAAGFFKIVVQGRGAHGSRPDQAIDPILIGARIVEALAALSREVSPFRASTLSVCRFEGGTNGNVIPDVVEIEGTLRYLDKKVGKMLTARVQQVARGICSSMGATCRFSYEEPYIPTVNHPSAVELGQRVSERLLGKARWQEAKNPSMGGEDFAYYLQKHPGAMFWLGMGKQSHGVHNPRFDFNDRAIRNGMIFLAGCALEALQLTFR